MYIKPIDLKTKRATIRKMFPVKNGWKWSVTGMERNAGVVVTLMQYPRGYDFPEHANIDHCRPHSHCMQLGMSEAEAKVMSEACMVMLAGSHDEADRKPHYHTQLKIGKWDEPCRKTNVINTVTHK